MKSVYVVCLLGLFSLSSSMAFAFDASKVPEKKRTSLGLYLSPKEAYELTKKEKALFIDVRTREEVNFLGMPTIADANIPYMEMDPMYSWNDKKNTFKLLPNSEFVSLVAERVKAKGLDKNSPIILMCRSGDRSALAANLLAKDGYTKVYSIVTGFEGNMSKKGRRSVDGWKNAGLPWTYNLSKAKMSLE
jgi:rhodanese-related sulfurtransferase